MTWADEEETATFFKRGNYLEITIETFLRDKLNRLSQLPILLADSWFNTVGAAVANVFTNNSDIGPTLSDSGALFNNKKHPSRPLVGADNPVGEWNTFRIRMVGEKVSVWLNDQLVVDDVVMENYWERDKPIYPTGQIELQNHGNTLYFKNIFLKVL